MLNAMIIISGPGRANICDGRRNEPNNSYQHSTGDQHQANHHHHDYDYVAIIMMMTVINTRDMIIITITITCGFLKMVFVTQLHMIVQDAVEGLMKQAADEVFIKRIFFKLIFTA